MGERFFKENLVVIFSRPPRVNSSVIIHSFDDGIDLLFVIPIISC